MATSNGQQFVCQVGNGSIDTGSNYSMTILAGNGSTAASVRGSNRTSINLDYYGAIDTTAKTTYIVNFQNYSNTTTNKTVLLRSSTGYSTEATVGLWRSTSAINTISLSGTTFATGSTFNLYGIAAASVGAKATGGDIYTDSRYFYHVFDANGTFTPTQSISADILVVAGGGGGGAYGGGGGGAGGYRLISSQSLTNATAYTCTVGAGGAAGVYNSSQAVNGVNSSISGTGLTTITASGGGYGGSYPTGTQAGGSGGSGGGSWQTTGGAGNSGSYSPVEGFAGGNGAAGGGYNETSGGGGGAGAVGQNATVNSRGGDGGIGNTATFSTWGLATGIGQNVSGTYYIAGGGGAGQPGNITAGAQAIGGFGGGGNGSTKSNLPSVAGSANTGGGGGGGSYSGTPGSIYAAAAGGSGVVIVRYAR
jgi:hypothetical protein